MPCTYIILEISTKKKLVAKRPFLAEISKSPIIRLSLIIRRLSNFSHFERNKTLKSYSCGKLISGFYSPHY